MAASDRGVVKAAFGKSEWGSNNSLTSLRDGGGSVSGGQRGLAPVYSEEVLKRSAEIGIKEHSYFWIAEQSLQAPLRLPLNWFEAKSEEGYTYYFNSESGESIWTHPALEVYKQLYVKNKAAGTNMSSNISVGSVAASFGYNARSDDRSISNETATYPAISAMGESKRSSPENAQAKLQATTRDTSPPLRKAATSIAEDRSPIGGGGRGDKDVSSSADYWYSQLEASNGEKKRLIAHNSRMEEMIRQTVSEQTALADARDELLRIMEDEAARLGTAARSLVLSLDAKGYPGEVLKSAMKSQKSSGKNSKLSVNNGEQALSDVVGAVVRLMAALQDPVNPGIDDRNYLRTWEGVSVRITEEMHACFPGSHPSKLDRGPSDSNGPGSLGTHGIVNLRDRLEALSQIISTFGEYLPEDERRGYIFSLLKHIGRFAKGSTMVPLELIVSTMSAGTGAGSGSAAGGIENVMRERLAIEPPSSVTALRHDLDEEKKQVAKLAMQLEKKTHEAEILAQKLAGAEARLEDSHVREESLLNKFTHIARGMEEIKDAQKISTMLSEGASATEVSEYLSKIANITQELELANKRAVAAERRTEAFLKQESELKSDVQKLDSTLNAKLDKKRIQIGELQERNDELEKVSNELYIELQNALALSGRLDAECIGLRRELDMATSADKAADKLSIQLADETARSRGLERSISEYHVLLSDATEAGVKHADRIVNLEDQLQVARQGLRERSDEVYRLRSRNENLAAANEGLEATVKDLKRMQMALNDKIVELQGNIRVFCRMRPRRAGDNTTPAQVADLAKFPDYNLIDFNSTPYEFDRVFDPESSQTDVFDEIVPAVRAVMTGSRLCIFAYGQTGSGKTHTMEGSSDNSANKGINIRCLDNIFLQASADVDVHTVVKMSLLEVYNEKIVDLLNSKSKAGSTDEGLEVRVGKGGSFVEGLSEWVVASTQEVQALITQGAANRKVASNNVNEHSSRSHAVILVKVEREDRITGRISSGRMCLCDLAGSERVKTTAATGQRLREAQHINKSLSALGDVISAMAVKQAHIPYRNSKLTFLLQDYIREHAKVIMFVNISPVPEYAGESICSLNFASRCRSVTLGQSKLSIAFAQSERESRK